MTTTATPVQIPAGTWAIDRLHSTAAFAVRHMVVATFRGGFTDLDATLRSGDEGLELEGTVRADSITVDDPQLRGHLLSPEFFDVERTPEIRFTSTAVRVSGEDAEIDGILQLKGHREAVQARGRLSYIEADVAGNEKVGLELEAIVDRRAFGLNWNAPLPKGGFALANEVTLSVQLELVRA